MWGGWVNGNREYLSFVILGTQYYLIFALPDCFLKNREDTRSSEPKQTCRDKDEGHGLKSHILYLSYQNDPQFSNFSSTYHRSMENGLRN